jgi:hypothetical protein
VGICGRSAVGARSFAIGDVIAIVAAGLDAFPLGLAAWITQARDTRTRAAVVPDRRVQGC